MWPAHAGIVQLPIVLPVAPAPRLAWLRRRPNAEVESTDRPIDPPIVAPPHPLQDPTTPWWSDAQLW